MKGVGRDGGGLEKDGEVVGVDLNRADEGVSTGSRGCV